MEKESMIYEVPAIQGYSEWEKFEPVRGLDGVETFSPNPNVHGNIVDETDDGF